MLVGEVGELEGGAEGVGAAGAGDGVHIVVGGASGGGDGLAVVEEELDSFPECGDVTAALEAERRSGHVCGWICFDDHRSHDTIRACETVSF